MDHDQDLHTRASDAAITLCGKSWTTYIRMARGKQAVITINQQHQRSMATEALQRAQQRE